MTEKSFHYSYPDVKENFDPLHFSKQKRFSRGFVDFTKRGSIESPLTYTRRVLREVTNANRFSYDDESPINPNISVVTSPPEPNSPSVNEPMSTKSYKSAISNNEGSMMSLCTPFRQQHEESSMRVEKSELVQNFKDLLLWTNPLATSFVFFSGTLLFALHSGALGVAYAIPTVVMIIMTLTIIVGFVFTKTTAIYKLVKKIWIILHDERRKINESIYEDSNDVLTHADAMEIAEIICNAVNSFAEWYKSIVLWKEMRVSFKWLFILGCGAFIAHRISWIVIFYACWVALFTIPVVVSEDSNPWIRQVVKTVSSIFHYCSNKVSKITSIKMD